MNEHEQKPRLVVHIGSGKTGSSSIQTTLQKNECELINQGFKYLGLMLENIQTSKRYEWQFKGGSDLFFQSDPSTSSKHAYDLLLGELQKCEKFEIHTLIWSNEWMFSRDKWVLPALDKISQEGYDVEIICYVRRHDKWSISAYLQWGIKHKTYLGEIKKFSDWVATRDLRFFPSIEPWLKTFGKNFKLLNYDYAGDVFKHFSELVGLEISETVQDNVTPSEEVLAAWAVFNDEFFEEVTTSKFETIAARAGLLGEKETTTMPLNVLYPSENDIAKLRAELEVDRDKLNDILKERDEPALSFDPFELKKGEIEAWQMNVILLRLSFSLQRQVDKMQMKIKNLEEQIKKPDYPQ